VIERPRWALWMPAGTLNSGPAGVPIDADWAPTPNEFVSPYQNVIAL